MHRQLLPAPDEGVVVAAGDGAVRHARPVHPRRAELVGGGGILKLRPEDAVDGAGEDGADVREHPSEHEGIGCGGGQRCASQRRTRP